nr:hypothetical protein [Tanacetum cinerariifolium]
CRSPPTKERIDSFSVMHLLLVRNAICHPVEPSGESRTDLGIPGPANWHRAGHCLQSPRYSQPLRVCRLCQNREARSSCREARWRITRHLGDRFE